MTLRASMQHDDGAMQSKAAASLARRRAPLQALIADDAPVPTAFRHLRLPSLAPLRRQDERVACGRCGRSRHIYCYECCEPLTQVPRVRLPLRVHMVKHAGERAGKSTGLHARLLAPDDVSLHHYPMDFPSAGELEHALLLFPSADAIDVRELPRSWLRDAGGAASLVVLDGTWRQAPGMARDPRLQHLTRIRLPDTERTMFWREQRGKPDSYLATIEALHSTLVGLHTHFEEAPYDGRFDALLYYYVFMYERVQTIYKSTDWKNRKNLKLNRRGYIQYDQET